jgi:hypothetical protein
MHLSPFDHKVVGTARKPSAIYSERLNLLQCITSGVLGMKVRRCMIVVVHVNRDSKEQANARHSIRDPQLTDC